MPLSMAVALLAGAGLKRVVAFPMFPARAGNIGGTGKDRDYFQGSEYVFTWVKLFIASCTPSL